MLQYENNNWKNWMPKRGEIYLVDLGDTIDSEMAGLRPFLILSNNIGNRNASIVSGAPITSRNKCLPIHVLVSKKHGLKIDSYVLTEHIRSISKRRFFAKDNVPVLMGCLSVNKMFEVENAIRLELGISS